MIIFLHGQDTYRSRQKLQEIIEHYQKVHKSGLNLKFFDGKSLSYQDFKDEFQQTPMFQEKKLLILRNVFQNQEFRDSFLENSQKIINPKDIIVFQEEGRVSPDSPLFKFLKKNAKIQEFRLLEGRKLRSWAKKEFEKYKTEIQPKALEVLINCVGNDLWRLFNEIQKLATFKKNKTIETNDIALLVRPRIEIDIFRTIRALAFRNKKQALALIHKHLERGDHPLYLLAMINYQFRNLLTRKRNNLFTSKELKKIYHRLFEVDLAVKTGQIDPTTALDLLITEI